MTMYSCIAMADYFFDQVDMEGARAAPLACAALKASNDALIAALKLLFAVTMPVAFQFSATWHFGRYLAPCVLA